MPAPTNISAGTATLVSIPSVTDQEVAFGGTVYTVWFKVVATLGFLAASFKAENTNPGGSSYVPNMTLYESDGTTEIAVPDTLTPIQIGTLAAQTYYIKIGPDVSDILTSPLRLTVNKNPSAPIVASYVLITDDGQSGNNVQGLLPGVIINPVAGEVSNIVFPLAQGDYGDILPSGVMCLENFKVDDLVFYAPDFDVIATVDLSTSTDFLKIRANNDLGVFLVSHRQSSVTKFKVFDDTGAQLLTKNTTLTQNPRAAALLNDNDTVLYALQSTGVSIKSWILSTNVAGADFVTGVVGYNITDILVLDNDEVLALFVGADTFVRRYDSAGVLQQTYLIGTSLAPNGALPRMGYDANGGQTAFWVWWFPTLGTAEADKIQISDGSILQTFTVDTYEEGVAVGANPADFGPSNSCPIIILGTNNELASGSNTDGTLFVSAAPPAANASGIYRMVPGKTNDTIWTEVGVTDEDRKIP